MIIYDFEIFKHDWLICWLDTDTRKLYHIINDKPKFEKFYNYYKNQIWVGYNSREYDQWIAKSILCDFNPFDMSTWIIKKDRKGFEYSKLLNNFPIMNYDCKYFFSSLKELEAYMGHDIRETQVPFDIDRHLTEEEIKQTIKYCEHDVMETFQVFLETKDEFEAFTDLIKEYKLDPINLTKTKAQLSAIILGAVKQKHNDEFDIRLPDTLVLSKYQYVADFFINWAATAKASPEIESAEHYKKMALKTDVCGVPHVFGIGGIHGAINKYYGEGTYIMADVGSYYPAIMIEYDFLSRNVSNKNKFREIRDYRIALKKVKDKRQESLKIVLNGTYGASKDKYNALYDPLQGNNVCVAGQLLLLDLLEKLEGKCEIIQSNTDGIMIKLFKDEDKTSIMEIFKLWMQRTRMTMDFYIYRKVIQKDVNNYIVESADGEIKRKGAYVKELKSIDNDLPIVNEAIVNYYINGISPEETITPCNELIKFQKVVKVSGKYSHALFNPRIEDEVYYDSDGHKKHRDKFIGGTVFTDKTYRTFASTNRTDGTLYKVKKQEKNPEKFGGTPEKCFIDNTNIETKSVPPYLDKKWYVDLANQRIKEFIN